MQISTLNTTIEQPRLPLDRSSAIKIADDGIYLKDGPNTVYFKWLELPMIVSEDHQSCFIGVSRRVIVRESLKGFEESIRPYGFIRINRKTIFNLRYVKKFTSGANPRVFSTMGQSFPITRRRKMLVRKEYEAFLDREQNTAEEPPLKLVSFRSKTPLGVNYPAGQLWINPQSKVKQYLETKPDLKPEELDIVQTIARTSSSTWLGEWNASVYCDVKRMLQKAEGSGSIPVFTVYRLFLRDETKTHAPQLAQIFAYKRWVQELALALAHNKAVIILEPNALSMLDESMPSEWQEFYLDALRFAVACLSRLPNVLVYLDAGHAAWRKPMEMAVLLARTGVDFIQGFAVNVSHFIDNASSHAYGREISGLLGGKPFVIDTSRNGLGIRDPQNWCNPEGVGLGSLPQFNPKLAGVDAFLWIKPPGESDGSCLVEQPSDGAWWLDRAVRLGQHARFSH